MITITMGFAPWPVTVSGPEGSTVATARTWPGRTKRHERVMRPDAGV